MEPWWGALQNESIEATDDIRSAIEREATRLQASRQPIPRPETDQTIFNDEVIWVPECPRWTGLWEVYSGDEVNCPEVPWLQLNQTLLRCAFIQAWIA